ncbi:MAG: hypothetical protein ACI8ZN_000349 [Bacteroidia bacterium]
MEAAADAHFSTSSPVKNSESMFNNKSSKKQMKYDNDDVKNIVTTMLFIIALVTALYLGFS